MKTLLISYKFLFMALITLPLVTMCSNDEEDDVPENPTNSAELVELTTLRTTALFNTSNGMHLNDVDYPNANLSLLSFGISNVIGEFGASNGEEQLEINMEIARQQTIDENLNQGASVSYKRGWQYDLLDAVIINADYHLTKKNGSTLFITKDGLFKTELYPMGVRYIEGSSFSSAGLFKSYTNGYNILTAEAQLGGIIYYSEDEVFSYDEGTSVPMYQYVDFRMLLHFRYLIRNGATNVILKGVKEDGSEMTFTINANSDLIALSEEFETNGIKTIQFKAKADYRVDYFNGIIFSSEAGDDTSHQIEYQFGQPIFN